MLHMLYALVDWFSAAQVDGRALVATMALPLMSFLCFLLMWRIAVGGAQAPAAPASRAPRAMWLTTADIEAARLGDMTPLEADLAAAETLTDLPALPAVPPSPPSQPYPPSQPSAFPLYVPYSPRPTGHTDPSVPSIPPISLVPPSQRPPSSTSSSVGVLDGSGADDADPDTDDDPHDPDWPPAPRTPGVTVYRYVFASGRLVRVRGLHRLELFPLPPQALN